MKDFSTFLIYLAVMAGVTYLIRMLPLVLFRRKIESRFIRSVLYYMPYAVLTAMTVPAVFSSTGAFIPVDKRLVADDNAILLILLYHVSDIADFLIAHYRELLRGEGAVVFQQAKYSIIFFHL